MPTLKAINVMQCTISPCLKTHRRMALVEGRPKPQRRSIWDGKRYRTVYTNRTALWAPAWEVYFSRQILQHTIDEIRLSKEFAELRPKSKPAKSIRFFRSCID